MTTNNVFAWSGTPGSNTDVAGNGIAGSNNISLGNDVFQNIMAQITNGMITRGSDIATASTVDFTAATTPSLLHDLTGTTTVTAVTMTAGWWRLCRAQGAFQLTASSTLVVNGSTSTNYTTTAGDLLIFFGYSASTVRVWTFTGGAGLPLTGGTLTGNLTISKANPVFTLNKGASGQDNFIFGQTNGLRRWLIDPGNATAEGGANAGSDFSIYNYDDTGAFVSETLKIARSTGRTTLQGLTTTNATGGDKGADTINAKAYYIDGSYSGITPFVSYTPTFVGFGTVTNIAVQSRRVGSMLQIVGKFTIGTSTGVTASVTLGYNGTSGNVTAALTPTGNVLVGTYTFSANFGAFTTVLCQNGATTLTFGASGGSTAGLTSALGSGLASSCDMSINAMIPITGW